MAALPSDLRKQLEKVIVDARNLVVADVADRLRELNVHEGKRGALSDEQAALRVRLRAHGRQIGDRRNSQSGAQSIDRLIQETAYEQWHRMIFVRFLAENEFLIEPEMNVALSMELLRELAEEADESPWQMGARFATESLPAVFRPDDPMLEVRLSRETLDQLEGMLESLPPEIFTADDSLGWVYQFWQSEEKDRVNAEGAKITGETLPAVTQLFTEHYMVLFLLHNTLGAWHAGKVLDQNPELAESAQDEDELRRAVAIDGYDFEYLRFVREPVSNSEPDLDEADAEALGPWRPIGGTYPGWPRTTAELKVLDPSCGSGHFLVEALELLVRLRIHEEGISVEQAVSAVLDDNLFGLEIDPRCTQIAAFNLTLAAWRLAGQRELPPMRNLACSGIPLGVSRDDWMLSLSEALPDSGLGFQWGQLYDMFARADTLGSLVNPRRFFGSGMLTDEQLNQISDSLAKTIANAPNATNELQELAAAAQGLMRATELLAGQYSLVTTNVPYLGRRKQNRVLKDHIEQQYRAGKADLATAFVLRCLEFCERGGTAALVTPQNWLFLTTYQKLRENLLERCRWDFVARLGPAAFETITGHVVNVMLTSLTADHANEGIMSGIDATPANKPSDKASVLSGQGAVSLVKQKDQFSNPDSRITLESLQNQKLLSDLGDYGKGSTTGDRPRFLSHFWEFPRIDQHSVKWLDSPTPGEMWSGRTTLLKVPVDAPELREQFGCWIRGNGVWGKRGVAVNKMSGLEAFLYDGEVFDDNICPIVPNETRSIPILWAFVSDRSYAESVRAVDSALKVTAGTITKVLFDEDRWTRIAQSEYPNGLPDPESDDPTQWLFHGRPDASTAPLQVAVGRLLGFQWPAEFDGDMRLSQHARELVARCDELDEYVDEDSIVCIPSVRGEDPATDRLMSLCHAAGVDPGDDLENWLRNRFFQEHCDLFQQRPFIWHIWDGRKDGFSALVNYHKLASPGGAKLLESLTYSYLGDWITRQEAAVKAGEAGADARLVAARSLQQRLKAILLGEPPFDLFIRWKPLHEQPIGWTPDINDGVRMNIRPFMGPYPGMDLEGGRKGAGVLRFAPKIKWKKDRGKEPKRPIEDYPWFWSWDQETEDFAGGDKFTGERWNDCHYTNAFKQAAREAARDRDGVQP
jgi:hypothetical protein